MSEGGVSPAALWADVVRAAEILAVEPFLLGGMTLRAWPGPPRERVLGWLKALRPAEAPFLRLPLHISDDRLLGGLSLAATLRRGSVVLEQGLLAQADGGVVVAAMAERMEPRVTSQLCAALDREAILVERDGLSATVPCRFAVVALDEGLDDERAPAALRDRLALQLDLSPLPPGSRPDEEPDAGRVERARARLPRVTMDPEAVDALCNATLALGIDSLRAPVLAATVARVNAALCGRDEVEQEDLSMAARLVLGPRATRVPVPDTDDDDEAEPPPPEPPPEEPPPDPEQDQQRPDPSEQPPLDDIVLEAAKSGIPAGLLDLLMMGLLPRSSPRSAGQSGALRTSTDGGRPAGVRPGMPKGGERLNVVETLRASAPWQPIRRRERSREAHAGRPGHEPVRRKVEVRKDDFRVTRFKQRSQTSVIFSVDASGSSAMQRLAEAKGAVEQVLSDCYVRRDHVALIAFRNAEATLLLPPTRSLVRVRRCLADLAGGGTTPLAAGIDAALALAEDARKRGHTPVVVVMTDGRANVTRDGRDGRAAAESDALEAARAIRAAQVRALFLDTSPRPRPGAQKIAAEMGARYLPLPYLDAQGISTEVQRLAEDD